MLEDHSNILAGFAKLGFIHGRQLLPVHKDLPPRGNFQHVDTPDQCRLSGTRQADDTENLPLFHFDIRFLQCFYITSLAKICLFDVY